MKRTKGEKLFGFLNTGILIFLCIITVYPVVYILSLSFSSTTAILKGSVLLLPKEPTIDGYKLLLQDNQIWLAYANTVFYTVVGTLINIYITLTAAYTLSRKSYSIRSPIMLMIAFTMFFSGGMVPNFILINQLRMYDTIWAILIPGAVSAWNLVLARVYLQDAVHQSLTESATIDGANDVQMFFKIALPLSTPIIAVLCLFYGIDHWNSYFNAMIYLKDSALQPVSLYLRRLIIMGTAKHEGFESEKQVMDLATIAITTRLKYCTIVVTLFPVMCIYPFLQKYFVSGIAVGAIKE